MWMSVECFHAFEVNVKFMFSPWELCLWAPEAKKELEVYTDCVFSYVEVYGFLKVKTFLVIVRGKRNYEYPLIISVKFQGYI